MGNQPTKFSIDAHSAGGALAAAAALIGRRSFLSGKIGDGRQILDPCRSGTRKQLPACGVRGPAAGTTGTRGTGLNMCHQRSLSNQGSAPYGVSRNETSDGEKKTSHLGQQRGPQEQPLWFAARPSTVGSNSEPDNLEGTRIFPPKFCYIVINDHSGAAG